MNQKTSHRRLHHLARTLAVAPGPVASSSSSTQESVAMPNVPLLDEGKYYKSLRGLPTLATKDEKGFLRGYDVSTWTTMDLLERAKGLGATPEQLNGSVEAADSRAALLALVKALEPPPPETVKVEDITVDANAPVEEMVKRLHTFGAVVLTRAADPDLINAVDFQVEQAGGWSKNPEDRAEGSRDGRAGMDFLVRAPALEGLYCHPAVLGCVKALLGPYCRRVCLKEIEIFAVQPGQGKQIFHREDNFWPWHHEPHPWAVSVLWAVDDFTPENGGTRMLPYSHIGRIREAAKEMIEGSYDESQVLKLKMPRGSVLIFTGGLVHAGGQNTTDVKRKSVLTGYQLGWLRAENKFYAYKPLHDALVSGQFSDEMARLLGHADRSDKNEGWTGTRRFDNYNGLRGNQSKSDPGMQEGEAPVPHLTGQRGFEPIAE